MTAKRAEPAAPDFFIGKCQSCRHSIGTGKPGIVLRCTAGDGDDATRPQWTCSRYEYEPGSLG